MEINIIVHTDSNKVKVVESNDIFEVWVKSDAKNGSANQELKEIIAKRFNIDPKSVKIIKGQKSRKKLISIKC